VARRVGATALTDVTGFGLAGHLREMLGEHPERERSMSMRCRRWTGPWRRWNAASSAPCTRTTGALWRSCLASRGELPLRAELLFDPQTSGGLLMAVPAAGRSGTAQALRESGVRAASIGELHEAERAGESRLRLCSRAALS
jgi:selenide,water dikinase